MLLMFIKRLLKRSTEQQHSTEFTGKLENIIISIQNGDISLRNELIHQYQPFVTKVTNKVCKRYVDRGSDDEYSIALSAFNEAIDAYRSHLHPSFLAFSETVIRRRLIDYFRKESKYQLQVPMSSFDVQNEDEIYNPIETQMAVEEHSRSNVIQDRKWEIEQFSLLLKQYGMTISDLVDASPKHSDTREMLISVSQMIAQNESFSAHVIQNKTLPLKDLTPLVDVSRKTLERNRKYILALSLIQIHEFHYLQEYLKGPEGKEGVRV